MSTLNSSQLYVKRSSTRLHAPPGGHSSLSFGSGGFGTTDASSAVVSDAKSAYSDPAEPLPPSSAGSFRGSGTAYGAYNHPAKDQSGDGSYGAPAAFHAIKGYAPVQGGAPMSSHGYSGPVGGPMGGTVPFPGHASDVSRPASTQSNLSWGERGSQPPLTSSKRDQNWEKKRRLWLVRKQGGGSGVPVTPYSQLPPPPGTGFGGGYYEPAALNPPSPLTKFMAQQSHSKPFTPQTPSHGGYDQPMAPPSSYGTRPPSSSGDYAAPPRTAMQGYREDMPGTGYSGGGGTSSHGLRQALPSSGGAYYAPANATAGGYGGGSPAYGGGAMAPPRTSMPGTAFSAASSTSATSRRQPPGGSSNWNPYS